MPAPLVSRRFRQGFELCVPKGLCPASISEALAKKSCGVVSCLHIDKEHVLRLACQRPIWEMVSGRKSKWKWWLSHVNSVKSWPILAALWKCHGNAVTMPWSHKAFFVSTVGSSHNPDGSASNGEECFRLCIATEVAPSSTERIPKECYIVWWWNANISKYLQMPRKCHGNAMNPWMSLSLALSIWEPLLAGAALELVEEPTPTNFDRQ